ncbi:MAG TPA: flippase [Candidatus Dormibacteraeota bacterium]|nr:flippase [Candidatus Dormibacteraeota bacterium]
MSVAQRAVRGTTILFVARTGSKLFVLAAFLLQQHTLGARLYGEFSLIVVLSTLSSIVGDLGLQIVYLREGSRDNARLKTYLAAVLAAKIPLFLLSLATLALMAAVAGRGPGFMALVLPAFALQVATSVANVLRSTFYATGEMRYEAVATVSEAVILLVGTFFVARAHLAVADYLWVYALSYAVTCVYAYLIIGRRYFLPSVHFDPVLARRLLKMALPFAMVFFLNTVYFRIDVVILSVMRGLTEVGYYTAAYKFLDGLSFVPQTIMNAVFPTLSVVHLQAIASMRQAYTATIRLLAALAVPFAVVLGFGAPAILGASFIGVYPQSAPALQILALAIVFMFVNSTFVFGLGAMDRQMDSVLLSVMSIVVNVALNLILIPIFPRATGYLGSSWATVLTEVFLLVAGYLMVRRRLEYRLPWGGPLTPILVSGALMVGVMGLLSQLNIFLVAVLAGLIYLGALYVTGGISAAELRTIRTSLGRRLSPVVGDDGGD